MGSILRFVDTIDIIYTIMNYDSRNRKSVVVITSGRGLIAALLRVLRHQRLRTQINTLLQRRRRGVDSVTIGQFTCRHSTIDLVN